LSLTAKLTPAFAEPRPMYRVRVLRTRKNLMQVFQPYLTKTHRSSGLLLLVCLSTPFPCNRLPYEVLRRAFRPRCIHIYPRPLRVFNLVCLPTAKDRPSHSLSAWTDCVAYSPSASGYRQSSFLLLPPTCVHLPTSRTSTGLSGIESCRLNPSHPLPPAGACFAIKPRLCLSRHSIIILLGT
jgi:hypothetical protein